MSVYSIEPSPSGDLLAVAAGNRKEQGLDVILVSAKNGEVIRNLTKGFDKDLGFEYIATAGGQRFTTVSWMSWAPAGDRLAYFVRTEKHRSLVLQNVVNRKIEQRVELKAIDSPESPDIDPTGRYVVFSGLQGAVGDIFMVDLQTDEVTNLTSDEFGQYAPTFSPDGKSLVFVTRVSGADKLFSMDLQTKQRRQLTFGTHDDGGPQFLDADTLVFSSTATDPNKSLDPEVAKNGNVYNIWTLGLKTGQDDSCSRSAAARSSRGDGLAAGAAGHQKFIGLAGCGQHDAEHAIGRFVAQPRPFTAENAAPYMLQFKLGDTLRQFFGNNPLRNRAEE